MTLSEGGTCITTLHSTRAWWTPARHLVPTSAASLHHPCLPHRYHPCLPRQAPGQVPRQAPGQVPHQAHSPPQTLEPTAWTMHG
jgi:hypothetical protein